jgi:hypothetical protein
MLSEVLVFLKNRLNIYLNSGQHPDESQEDRVVFLDGQNIDPLVFNLGAI